MSLCMATSFVFGLAIAVMCGLAAHRAYDSGVLTEFGSTYVKENHPVAFYMHLLRDVLFATVFGALSALMVVRFIVAAVTGRPLVSQERRAEFDVRLGDITERWKNRR